MSSSTNPYLAGLAGYEQFIQRPDLERSRADPQPSYFHPAHPMLNANATSRTPGLVTRTNAVPSETGLASVSLQQVTDVDGTSSIDILVPTPSGGPSSQLAQADNAVANTRPQTPNTLNIIARPSGATNGQVEPPTVEITISTQPEELQPYVSHLQGLTVQQMLDLDIDSLVVKIDEHHSQAKKAVLDHFMETKGRLLQAKNNAVEEERGKCAARLATKDEEVNLMKEEVNSMRSKAQRLTDLVARTCTVYSNAKERRRISMLQFQVFCAWRQQAMLLSRRRRLLARAERWEINVHLKRNVFRAWFREAMRAHRVTVNNRYIQEVEQAKRLIHEHYQLQITDLERMLAEAHQQLEREAETRSRLEEDMKRAFMRGVCALNIEAMNMMKRGAAPPGGGNPASAVMPLAADQPPPEPAAASGSLGPSASAYTSQASSVAPLSDAANTDLRGSITLSPPRFIAAQSGSGGAGSVGGAGTLASSGQHPAGVAGARLSGSGASSAPTVTTALTGGSSRPGSSYGPALTGTTAAVAGRANVAFQQAAAAGPGSGAAVSGGGAEGGPMVRETAQTFYQRPQVVVTRGPGVSFATSNAEVPRPRSNAPLPTVRML